MAAIYEVYGHSLPQGSTEPRRFCNTTRDDSGYGPWLACSHHHVTYAEADTCRDFVGED
jgi:hypothetical protein